MSIVCYYVRADDAALDIIFKNPEIIYEGADGLPKVAEVLYIDKAYDAISWLVSPLKRAEELHNFKLNSNPNWSGEMARASVARLKEMVVDDAYAAIGGQSGEILEDFGMGLATAMFRPERVKTLALALSEINEATLRRNVDYALMHEHDISPSGWLEEGEDILTSYTFPALQDLQSFYKAASASNQTVLIVWT